MSKLAIMVALFLCMNSAQAEVVNLQGKITKGSDAGVAGAHVSLKNYPFIAAISSADGTFHITSNTRAVVNPMLTSKNGVAVRHLKNGHGLFIMTAGRFTAMRVDIYNSNGRMIASKRFSGSNGSEHIMPFADKVSAMYVVKVSIDNESRIFKTIPGIGVSYALISEKTLQATNINGLGKSTGSISDSLVAVARGYRTALSACTTYEKSDIAISLTASNTWVPSEALEHSGGMVKIMAKDHDFEMGQTDRTVRDINSERPSIYEQPVHTVSFTHDFWMDTTEVTMGEYDSLMKIVYTTRFTGNKDWKLGTSKDLAVYSLKWGDAALFCNARSKIDQLPDTVYTYSAIIGDLGGLCSLENVSVNLNANAYRLPTEAEWEYACRGGTTTDYYWGKDFNDYRTGASKADIDSYAVWTHNSLDFGKTSPNYGVHTVASKKPNNYGLYDMAGNVSEWCNDWFDLYNWGPQTDPSGPSTVGPGYIQVRRGGNWGNDESYLRSTERFFYNADYLYFFMGFRTVRQIQ